MLATRLIWIFSLVEILHYIFEAIQTSTVDQWRRKLIPILNCGWKEGISPSRHIPSDRLIFLPISSGLPSCFGDKFCGVYSNQSIHHLVKHGHTCNPMPAILGITIQDQPSDELQSLVVYCTPSYRSEHLEFGPSLRRWCYTSHLGSRRMLRIQVYKGWTIAW